MSDTLSEVEHGMAQVTVCKLSKPSLLSWKKLIQSAVHHTVAELILLHYLVPNVCVCSLLDTPTSSAPALVLCTRRNFGALMVFLAS